MNYFSFTPAETGNYTISTCNGTGWDSRLLVMSTCSTASGVLNCNDDSCGLQSQVGVTLTAGGLGSGLWIQGVAALSRHAVALPPRRS